MTEELEKLRTEFNERIDALLKDKPTPQFEVGKWCKIYNGAIMLIKKVSKDRIDGYYIHDIHVDKNGWVSPDDIVGLATPEEVKQALVKEAEGRGFKEGVKFRPVVPNVHKDSVGTCDNSFNYFDKPMYGYEGDGLSSGKNWVYYQGQWAEIIKEEVIKIGGYEVKFHKGDPNDYYTTIDGHEFSYHFWVCAQEIADNPKAEVRIGCSKQFLVTPETINSILNKLK